MVLHLVPCQLSHFFHDNAACLYCLHIGKFLTWKCLFRFTCMKIEELGHDQKIFHFSRIHNIALDSAQQWPLKKTIITSLSKFNQSAQIQTASTNWPKLWETLVMLFWSIKMAQICRGHCWVLFKAMLWILAK